MSVTIVNGEAIDVGGAVPGNARLRKGSRTAKRVPNDLFRQARLALRSPSGSGRPMSRQELAEAANAWLYEQTGRVCRMDAGYIGMLERGETRWPWAHHRAGLRAALGAATDAEIGLWIIYGPAELAATTDSAGTEPAPAQPEPERGKLGGSGMATGAEQGRSLLRTILAERHWQVYRTFRVQFDQAARALAEREGDPTVRTLDVSERQFHRWVQGARPRPDACRVLESMFGHPIERLIGPVDAPPAMAADLKHIPHTAPERPVREADIGLMLSDVAASLAAVQVSVNAGAGAAVTVTCQDGALGRIAVVAGTVRVLIDTSGVDAGVVDAPMVAGGARVYSLAKRRTR